MERDRGTASPSRRDPHARECESRRAPRPDKNHATASKPDNERALRHTHALEESSRLVHHVVDQLSVLRLRGGRGKDPEIVIEIWMGRAGAYGWVIVGHRGDRRDPELGSERRWAAGPSRSASTTTTSTVSTTAAP